jgi:hypothetical protein
MDADRSIGTVAVNARVIFLSFLRRIALACALIFTTAICVSAQAVPYARTFAKPKSEVEQALKELQAYAGQKLPIVDGFVGVPEQPLNRYERAFYQFSIELFPGASGGTVVQLSAKITAWYTDKDPAKSGYQILPSNGRLELDLLDRLGEKFGIKPEANSAGSQNASGISTPAPKLNLGPGFNTPSSTGPPVAPPEGSEEVARLKTAREAEEKRMRSLSAELQSLEEVKKNQAHPLNLVTVKKPATPVLAHAGDEDRVLFKAAVNDEFEFLDMNGEWVHVQISGASRGYIRRSALELPEGIAAQLHESPTAIAKPESFRVTREESTVFPGTWEALKGKTVKIYTVQPVSQNPKETDARAKLNFAASLMKKFVEDPASGSASVAGVVVIFDSADGGIVGATLGSAQQFAQGAVSEEIFWKQSYLEPAETFQMKR